MAKEFKLTRIYSVASLIGIIIIAVALVIFYRTLSVDTVKQHEAQANVSLTQALANAIWPKYADFIKTATSIPAQQLHQQPEITQLRAEIIDKIRGLHVAKIKIYNLDGLTVFSTDPKQIGESKFDNKGLQSALSGEVASILTFRHQFDAYEKMIADRNLLSSYVPVRKDVDGAIEGVFEIYSDVTSLVNDINRTGYIILAGVITLLSVLYVFLYLIVYRADRIINEYRMEEQKVQQEKINYLAYYDSLTGLPNRNLFTERLAHALARRHESGKQLAILFLDLDNYKTVIDSLGHDNGDRLLQKFSILLHKYVHDDNTVARLGGDEFAILLESIVTVEQVNKLIQRIFEGLSKPFIINNNELFVTVSIGVSLCPGDSSDINALMKYADSAMFSAKDLGRNSYQFYSKEMSVQSFERLTLETSLRHALDRQEFVLYYQPQVDINSGLIIGAEALIRWQHPDLGLVAPMEFIPLLEETGLIVPVGNWVIATACHQARSWITENPSFRMSLNLSVHQFHDPELETTLSRILNEIGMAPESLELEITESILMQDDAVSLANLNILQQKGFRLSIDDFGTGYSSLSYLKRFPVDTLKIDRSFIHEMDFNPNDVVIIDAIIAMAHSLKLAVIAEGVETVEQLNLLRSRGCDFIQGYLYSPPVNAQDMGCLLTKGGKKGWDR